MPVAELLYGRNHASLEYVFVLFSVMSSDLCMLTYRQIFSVLILEKMCQLLVNLLNLIKFNEILNLLRIFQQCDQLRLNTIIVIMMILAKLSILVSERMIV